MKTILIAIFSMLGFILCAQVHVDELYENLFNMEQDDPGMALVIVEGDKVVYQRMKGIASLEHDIPLSGNTVFDLGTMSMHFTAAGILKLEMEGKLSLDDAVQKYLSDFPNYKEGEITIRHLLHHTSGVRDYIALLIASGKTFHETQDQKSAIETIMRQRGLTSAPGSVYRFSQSNYVLLAGIIEKVAGVSYSEYMGKNFFRPFGMNSTYVYDNALMLMKNRANGYRWMEEKWTVDQRYNFTTYGDGRIYSSANDLAKWAINIQQSPIYKNLIERGSLNDGSQMTYARGLEYGTFNGEEMFAHSGYFGAFTSMYLHFPSLGKTYIVLTNNWNLNAPGIAYDAAEMTVTAPVSEDQADGGGEIEYVDLDGEELNKFSGNYFYANYGYARELEVVNDTLMYTIDEQVTRKLLPVAENEFVAVGASPEARWVFTEDRMEVYRSGRLIYVYEKFQKANYTEQELAAYAGNYSSEELGVNYEVRVKNGGLVTVMDDREIAEFRPIYRGTFTSAHDGYIEMSRDGFTLNDYSLGKVDFKKKG